jgi:hypothetical protein
VGERIGEAADRRHTAPVASVTLWAAICAAAVAAVHALTSGVGPRLGSYRTGLLTLAVFLLAAMYSARKRSLWLSVRWLRAAARLPRAIARRMVTADRLETWRTIHITLGISALLPFWWHVNAGPATPLERLIFVLVFLVVGSGLCGTLIHDLMPPAMRKRPDYEVRLEDVETAYHQIYIEAEETILGHSEQLVRLYLAEVRPLLIGSQPPARLFFATLAGRDPAAAACGHARRAAAGLSGDRQLFERLIDLAATKIRLELNRFNLRLSAAWLVFHIALVAIFGVAVVFHIAGALYYVGLP